MALKGYRNHGCGTGSVVKHFMNEVAEKGIVVTRKSGSTGSGLPGDAQNIVEVPAASGNGDAIGILLTDVVDIDVTRFCHIGRSHRSETTPCNPVEIMDKGEVYTNMLADGATPAAGDDAYYTEGGLLTDDSGEFGPIGKFEGPVQSNGYVVVKVDL